MAKKRRKRPPRYALDHRAQTTRVVIEYDLIDLMTNWRTFIRLPRRFQPRI